MERATNTESAGVRTIKAPEFKARCLKLMDEIAATGEEIVIQARSAGGAASTAPD